MELPSCRFSHSGVLGRTLSDTDDDILEVAESNEANEENTSGIEASTSNSEDPAGKVPSKKICCPICLDDEETVSKKDLTCLISTFNFLYSKNPFFFLEQHYWLPSPMKKCKKNHQVIFSKNYMLLFWFRSLWFLKLCFVMVKFFFNFSIFRLKGGRED